MKERAHGGPAAAHGHAHAPGAGDERRLVVALALTGTFMFAEVAGGILTGSLALLADAGHMLTDTAALGLAWAAFRVARRPRDARRTYGYHRVQVLAAFVNAVVLFGVVAWILWEAASRVLEPVAVLGGPMLAVAALGLLVNIAAFAVLHGGSGGNLNLRAASLHVLGDLLGSVAAIAAALVILWTGWMPIDPLLSVLVALLVLRSAWTILRQSGHILLEGAPHWIDENAVAAGLIEAVPAVRGVHHLHAWMLTPERPIMTLHVEVGPDADHAAVLAAANRHLREHWGVEHVTVQIEPARCPEGAERPC